VIEHFNKPIGKGVQIMGKLLGFMNYGECLEGMTVATLADSNTTIPCELHITGDYMKHIDAVDWALDQGVKHTIEALPGSEALEVAQKTNEAFRLIAGNEAYFKVWSPLYDNVETEAWVVTDGPTELKEKEAPASPFANTFQEHIEDHGWEWFATNYLLSSAQENVFTLKADADSAVREENGHYYFNGNAVLTAYTDQAGFCGTLYVRYGDGTIESVQIESVEQHTCAGHWEAVALADGETSGVMAELCDTCGKVMQFREIPTDANFMLSDGTYYQTLTEAAAHANKEQDTITALCDTMISEDTGLGNVTFWVPDSVTVTVAENAHVYLAGTAIIEGTVSGDLSLLYLLNMDNESKYLPVTYGTEADAAVLPATDSEGRALTWYQDAECKTEVTTFRAGQPEENRIFYAKQAEELPATGVNGKSTLVLLFSSSVTLLIGCMFIAKAFRRKEEL
jgi:hypothetical protein